MNGLYDGALKDIMEPPEDPDNVRPRPGDERIDCAEVDLEDVGDGRRRQEREDDNDENDDDD